MLYEDLHRRYGSYIARRVRHELTAVEFAEVSVDGLLPFLEARAEAANGVYQMHFSRILLKQKLDGKSKLDADNAYQRWRDAEDLVYLIVIADDVSASVRAGMAK